MSEEDDRLWSIVRANSLDFNYWTTWIEETGEVAEDNVGPNGVIRRETGRIGCGYSHFIKSELEIELEQTQRELEQAQRELKQLQGELAQVQGELEQTQGLHRLTVQELKNVREMNDNYQDLISRLTVQELKKVREMNDNYQDLISRL